MSLWFKMGAEMGRKITLKAKCWDLTDAYKQVPLSDQAFQQDSFLIVYDPESQGPLIFQQKVLPFGSVASVTSFLRVSLGLWKVGTCLLSSLGRRTSMTS